MPGPDADPHDTPRAVVFVDLDDTLFSTLRKTPAPVGPAVAHRRDGAPLSYMSSAQRALFALLSAAGMLVPTTGRNVEAYRRIALPFTGPVICSFGGVILTADGIPEPRWHALISAEAARHTDALLGLVEPVLRLGDRLGADVRARAIEDAGNPLYLSVKHNQDDGAALARVANQVHPLVPPGWRVHHNDNNLAVMPPYLGKERAVAWFRAELAPPGALAIGIGDSLSDLPFMAACDFAMAPSGSQVLAAWRDAAMAADRSRPLPP